MSCSVCHHHDPNQQPTHVETGTTDGKGHTYSAESETLRQEFHREIHAMQLHLEQLIEKQIEEKLHVHLDLTASDQLLGARPEEGAGEPAGENETGNDCVKGTDEENDPRAYEVQESVWDTFLIAGIHTEGMDFAMLLFVAFVNLSVQIIFCMIVGETMTQSNNTHETMVNTALWRMIVGHKAEYYDPLTDTSLVTRVCEFPEYSIMAGNQASIFANVANYKMPSGEGGLTLVEIFSPPLLCLICLQIWVLNIIGDLLQTHDLFRALISLPRADKTTFLCPGDDTMTFTSISKKRLAAITFMVILPRFVIAYTLGHLGLYYLVYTPDVGDLILNALALQVVLDMDEFIYSHLVPMRIRNILATVQPLPISQTFRYPTRLRRKIPARALTQLFLLIVTVTTVVFTTMRTELNNVQATTELLCGGNQNFIYAQDAATGLISTADTSNSFESSDMFRRYAFRAVMQKTQLEREGVLDGVSFDRRLTSDMQGDRSGGTGDGEGRELQAGTGGGTGGGTGRALTSAGALYSTTATNKVHEMTKETASQAAAHLDCVDAFNDGTPAHLVNQSMRRAFQDIIGLNSCDDLRVENCGSAMTRSFCPETCECHIATSGMLNREGCSDSCFPRVDMGEKRDITALTTIPGACGDRTSKQREFKRYFQELQTLLIDEGKLVRPDPTRPDFVWLGATYLVRYAFSTEFSYWLDANTSIDLGAMAEESYNKSVAVGVQSIEQTPCKFIEVVYKLFAFDACHPDVNILGGRAGTLRTICPWTCGYCTDREPLTHYQYQSWNDLYKWMNEIANINPMWPVTYVQACNLYRGSNTIQMIAPQLYSIYFKFCHTDVGLIDGFAGWFESFQQVFPQLDVLDEMSNVITVPLPSSTTTTLPYTSTSTTSLSTTTRTTTTSSFYYMNYQQLQQVQYNTR